MALAAAWPGAGLVTTQDLGHVRILRDPAVVEAAVSFVCARDLAPEREPAPHSGSLSGGTA